MHALGSHLLVELRDCNPATLINLQKITDAMVSAAREAKATIVDVSFHEFNPFDQRHGGHRRVTPVNSYLA